ncbi:MAG: ATP-dependent helicase [Erysipelotrichaceae bacterium]
MVKFSELNNAQQEAVISDAKHLRIIAGAGSGKTRVLTMRIVYEIEELGVAPYNILAITFTNKAANEMKSRINQMLGDKGSGCFISTIHSLCMRILSQEIEVLGYPRNFTVVDQDDQKTVLKEAYKQLEIDKKDLTYGSVLDYIANNKYEHISPEKAMDMAYGEPKLELKAQVYDYYVKRLRQIYGLDFDDLILFTTRIFSMYPDIEERWARKFKYIHVDEFQDIDKEQYLLIKQLSSYHDNVYVVGDPDQTIYTWRGADVNIIVNFDKDFKDTKTIILNQNYRSTNNILSGANSLIKNNKARLEKDLFSVNGDGEKIKHKSFLSEADECLFVAEEVKKRLKEGKDINEMAVLYRSNYLSRDMEKVLIESRLPYVIYGGLRFYERMEVKDILSYLRMIVTGDDLAFQRIINTPKRGIGQKSVDSIYEIAQKNNMTMYDAVKNGLYAKNQNTMDSFVKMIEKWRCFNSEEPEELEELLEAVLDDSGYRAMLEEEKEHERLENIKSLIDDIMEYQNNYPGSSLADYLSMISLYTDRANEQQGEALKLMTIHAAKGLEFETVFVIGMSEGIFPSKRTVEEGQKGLEEERRLAYVAYTRAKKELYLLESSSFSFVLSENKSKSRFIEEVDKKYIESLNEAPKSGIFDIPVKKTNNAIFTDNIKTPSSLAKTNAPVYRKGDSVIHTMFGEGVVVSNINGIMTVAFSYPHGVKKISTAFKGIRKKNKNDCS